MQAFLAASLKTDAELLKWFRDRLIWNEPETVVDLLKNGLFVRLYEPQASTPSFMRAPVIMAVYCYTVSISSCIACSRTYLGSAVVIVLSQQGWVN